jgi:hypothetical protein
MIEEIRDYIRRCPACQLNESSNTTHATPPIRPLQPAAQPFDRWGIDFMQNLPETRSGYRHIITAIDYATRWIIAKPVKTMDENVVCRFLYEDILMNFGAPFEILSDRGKSFLSEGILQLWNSTLENFSLSSADKWDGRADACNGQSWLNHVGLRKIR